MILLSIAPLAWYANAGSNQSLKLTPIIWQSPARLEVISAGTDVVATASHYLQGQMGLCSESFTPDCMATEQKNCVSQQEGFSSTYLVSKLKS